MPLQKQMLSLPLVAGLDEKASDKHLQPPKLATCDNGKFSKLGQVQKRNGFTRLANASFVDGSADTVDATVQCASYKDERLIFDGNDAFARSDSGTWVDKGRITGCTFEDKNIFNSDGVTTGPLATARANDYLVEAWSEVDPDVATMVYQVYARVVDEPTGIEVVPKTRITPAAGISVTKAHDQNDDSNYLNPQVQAVAMGDYIFILLCDCTAQFQTITIDSVADLGGGFVQATCATEHPFLHGDVVLIAGTTSYNGNKVVLEPTTTTKKFSFAASFVATETGTVNVAPNYGKQQLIGVHAVAINTGSDIAAGLTPTALSNFNSPAFWVNATYPLFSVCAMSPTSDVDLANMASVFRFNPAPIGTAMQSDTIAAYRMDYFEESSGAFIEYLEDNSPGYRGRNTPINDASDPDAYFQASESLHDSDSNDRRRTLSHICCTSMDAEDRIMVAATFQEDMTAGAVIGATQANPCVVADTSHPFSTGDFVLLQSLGGMTELNGNTYQITKIDANTFSLDGVDSTGFGAYTSGGTVTLQAPHVRTQTYDATDTPTKIAISQGVTEPNDLRITLISGSFLNFSASDCHFLFTGQATTLGVATSPDTGQAAEHNLYKASVDFTDGSVKSVAILKCFTTLTSDLFAYNNKFYFCGTYAITPTSGLHIDGDFDYINFGSSINVIGDTDGNMIATGGTGAGGNCAATDWQTNKTAGRTLFWNAARVSAHSASKFSFGASRFSGTSQGGLGRMTNRVIFNPSYAEIDFLPTRQLPWVDGAGSLLLAGGFLWEYGGDSMKENGFLTYPQALEDTSHSGTGGVLGETGGGAAVLTYKYIMLYEWTSSSGAVQRSYPSDIVTLKTDTLTNTQKFTIPVYTLQWSQKTAANGVLNPRIVLYRTEAGKSVFYRVKSIELDTTSFSQDITDDEITDPALVDNEPVYSTGAAGDIFGNIAPPCSTDIVMHKERVFLAIIDGSIWYSKKLSPREGVEFSEFQVKPIENYAGKIACLGAVRDYVIAITDQDAYFLAGDGPNAAGGGTDFSPPTIFSRDSGANLGCARTNSPLGFIYRAKGGIYQVSPSMQLQWIGAPVEDTVDAYEPLRAVVNDSEGEIYFGLDSATYGFLVYNYVFNAWSTWKPRYAAFSSDITPKGMMVHNGTLNFAIPSGHLLEQNTGFTDIGSGTYDFGLLITTPWIRSEQFLHMVRFYNILISGTFRSNHTLNCTIYSNYDESVADAQALVVTSSNSSPYILRQHVAKQKVRAIKITISDNPTSGTYESYQLDGIAVEFGVRPGTFKLGATKTLT